MWEAQSFNRTPALNDSLFQENKKTHLILDFSLVLKLVSRLILFNSLIWSSRAVPFQVSLTQAGWDRPWYIWGMATPTDNTHLHAYSVEFLDILESDLREARVVLQFPEEIRVFGVDFTLQAVCIILDEPFHQGTFDPARTKELQIHAILFSVKIPGLLLRMWK